jgi:hypothetical protein
VKRLFYIIAIVVLFSALLFLFSGCQVDPQQNQVPSGVTVTIPEGL